MKLAKILLTLGFIFVAVGIGLIFLNINYTKKVQNELKEMRVPVAAVDINEKTNLTTTDFKIKKIKNKDIPEGIIKSEIDIVGFCVKEGKKIKKGEYFKESDIEVCEDNSDEVLGPDYYQ